MVANRKILLVQRPVEMFTESCFEVVEAPIPEPAEGEAVVKVEYVSLDPAMRGWARDEPSYLPPIPLGDVMRSGGAGHIVASMHLPMKHAALFAHNPHEIPVESTPQVLVPQP